MSLLFFFVLSFPAAHDGVATALRQRRRACQPRM
jgi:hypothetical protein